MSINNHLDPIIMPEIVEWWIKSNYSKNYLETWNKLSIKIKKFERIINKFGLYISYSIGTFVTLDNKFMQLMFSSLAVEIPKSCFTLAWGIKKNLVI